MQPDAVPILTYGLIILTVLATLRGFGSAEFFNRWKFAVGPILNERQYARLVTSGLLHANWGHLFFNMYCFHSFGRLLELVYGLPLLLAVYAASLLGGNFLSLWMNRRRPAYSAIGASGAVSGVIFASIFLLPGGAIRIMFVPVNIPAWLFAVAYLLISIFGIERRRGRIGHDAHLGGAITGMLATFIMYPRAILVSPLLFGGITLIMIGYLVYSAIAKNRGSRY